MLLAGAEPARLAWIGEALAGQPGYTVTTATSAGEVLAAVNGGAVDVVILGRSLRDQRPAELLAHLASSGEPGGDDDGDEAGLTTASQGASERGRRVVVLATDPALGADERLFFVIEPSLSGDDLRALLASARARRDRAEAEAASAPTSPEHATRVERVLEIARQLATQRDLEGAAELAVRAVLALVDADRAYCLFYDHDSGALWAESPDHECDGHAGASLAGFAARTAQAVHAPRADADPRWRRELDDHVGKGSEHILVQPMLGTDAQVHAVLIAVRIGDHPDFTAKEREELALLAQHAAPMLDLLARQVEAHAAIEAATPESPFRQEALEAYTSWQRPGDVVRVSPRWVDRVYALLVSACVAAFVYAAVGTVNEYSSGLAVVRMAGRAEITASVAGTIASVLVVPGQRVRAGQVLVELYDDDAAAEYRRIEEEFEAQLRNLLRSPGDPGVRQAVGSLRAQKERAASRVEERLIRAPAAGTISDVRIRPGQALSPGELVMSLLGDDADLSVIALLPGGDRPLLRPGMPMRLELNGYRYAYQDVTVSAVADEVIGPAEAARFLGARIADSLQLTGPVVLVRARLPRATFVVDDIEYGYHDGMQGRAEVRVRARTILETLIPALERL